MCVYSIKHIWMNANEWVLSGASYESPWVYLKCLVYVSETNIKTISKKWVFIASLFSQMESNFLLWRKSCTISSIFGDYQWHLTGGLVLEDFFLVKNCSLTMFGLMTFFSLFKLKLWNVSNRIQIFSERKLLANDWAVTGRCQMGIRCPVLTAFEYLNCRLSFANLSFWSEVIGFCLCIFISFCEACVKGNVP